MACTREKFRRIPRVIVADRIFRAAFPTRLDPLFSDEAATAVEALVSERIKQFEIFDPVVELVSVDMVRRKRLAGSTRRHAATQECAPSTVCLGWIYDDSLLG